MPIQTVSQAFSNEGVGGFSFRNKIINGAMEIDQRNAGASTNNAGGTTTYALDRWGYYGTSSSKFSIQQSSTAPTGFGNSTLITSLAATTIGTNDEYWLTQKIEGFNTADLAWGTSSAKTVTLSFWVRSSLTGTFGGSFTNSAMNYYYAFSYTINAANTWEQKTITVSGPTAGTWIGATNGVGMFVIFGLSAGSTYGGATANTWTSSSYKVYPTGATNILATNGATWAITGVQLEVGSLATPFERRPYGTELQLCQRYCMVYGNAGDGLNAIVGNARAANNAWFTIPCVPMRTTPSFSITNNGTLRVLAGGSYADSSANSTTVGGIAPSFTFDTAQQGMITMWMTNPSGLSWSANVPGAAGLFFNYGRFIFSAEL